MTWPFLDITTISSSPTPSSFKTSSCSNERASFRSFFNGLYTAAAALLCFIFSDRCCLPWPLRETTSTSRSLRPLGQRRHRQCRRHRSAPYPRTPPAARPMARMSDSLNRIDWPFDEERDTLSSPFSTKSAAMSSSPFCNFCAIKPERRTSWNAVASTFLATPCLVIIEELLALFLIFARIG